MILFIDTAQREYLKFALISKSEVFLSEKNVANKQSENMIEFLKSFLKNKKVSLKNLEKIIVNRGPGSFTSVRIGIVLANTLSFSLKIPVIGIENKSFETKEDYLKLNFLDAKNEFVTPFYDREPNIGKKL